MTDIKQELNKIAASIDELISVLEKEVNTTSVKKASDEPARFEMGSLSEKALPKQNALLDFILK